jgi:predicted AAA+ superfamily ATPase
MNLLDRIYSTLADIAGLSLFSGVAAHPFLDALRQLLEDLSGKSSGAYFNISGDDADSALSIIRDWTAFTQSFIRYQKNYSFYSTIAYLALTDDNPFTLTAEGEDKLPPVLSAVARGDLSRLGRIAEFDLPGLGFHIAETIRKGGLASMAQNIEEESRVLWAAEGRQSLGETPEPLGQLFPKGSNWGAALPAFIKYLRTHGAGLLGQYTFFRWVPSEEIQPDFFPDTPSLRPVFNPDRIGLSDLTAYEEQRSVVIANTLRFLEGKPANNLLLYGDRGTGKSATVKAVCNEYAPRGLRLVEVAKAELIRLPEILETLASRALRFIIFIDDLSFETVDNSFTTLKALLEGGVEARPANVVVYATSNRRHLVKENLADRPTTAKIAEAASTGDVRAFDTMQEQFSLADRFGLTLIFATPGQEEYLKIAEYVARRRGLIRDAAEDPSPAGEEKRRRFRDNALRWERWFNGRSPRTAAQYADWIAGGDGFPWE